MDELTPGQRNAHARRQPAGPKPPPTPPKSPIHGFRLSGVVVVSHHPTTNWDAPTVAAPSDNTQQSNFPIQHCFSARTDRKSDGMSSLNCHLLIRFLAPAGRCARAGGNWILTPARRRSRSRLGPARMTGGPQPAAHYRLQDPYHDPGSLSTLCPRCCFYPHVCPASTGTQPLSR